MSSDKNLRITLSDEGCSELEVKKSVFISYAKPIKSPEEAFAFVDEIRKKYPDARHTAYAWTFSGGTKMQKYSDDGEPSGTAGLPMLSVFEKNQITDAVVTVTRYFGGVLLGKGGLVRAYSHSASIAVEAGGIGPNVGENASRMTGEKCAIFAVVTDYSWSEKVIYELKSNGYSPENLEYTDKVSFEVAVPVKNAEAFVARMIDFTGGKIVPSKTGEIEAVSGKVSIEREETVDDDE